MDRAKTGQRSVSLVIPSRVEFIDLVHGAAEQIARLAGCDDSESLNVGIAVREAVINAILHGNANDPEREVRIGFEVDDDGMRATVLDQGAGFDPEQARDPTKVENLLESSGRGLLMIRAFVDDVQYRFHEGRGLEVTLVKHRPSGTGS